jgi:PAS domain S-box-containing protein
MDVASSSPLSESATSASRQASLPGDGGSPRQGQNQNQGQTPPSDRHAQEYWRGPLRWLQQNSFAPGWLPVSLRHPLFGYLVAVLLDLAAVASLLLILSFFLSFAFLGMLPVVVVLLVSLGWGAGPGLFATLVGTALLYFVVLPPRFTWAIADPADGLGVLLYAVIGVCVSVLASGSERRRRQAEELARELARAEARSARDYRRLRTVVDAMPNPVLIAGPQGQIEEINEATRTLWGGDIPLASEVAEYARYKAWWPKTGQSVAPDESTLARALSSGVAQLNNEMEIEALDGRHKTILASAVPIRDAGGAIVGAVLNAQDITEVRRLQRVAAERAAELEALFNAMSDGVALLDAQGNLVQTNRAFDQMLGLAQSPDLATRSMEEWVAALALHDDAGRPLPVGRWPCFRLLEGETVTAADVLVTTPAGRELAVNVTGAPLRSQTGQILGAVQVCRDVTARRQLEQRTRATLTALVAMGEALVQVLDAAPNSPTPEAEPVPPLSPLAPIPAPLVLRRLADLTREVLGCRRVSIGAVDPATGLVSPVAVVGLSAAEERAWWASLSSPQRLEERLSPAMAASLRAGEAVLLEAASLPERTRSVLLHARTGLVVPMRIGDALVGAALVDYGEQDHEYATPDEMQLTETMARLGAQVLERNRLKIQWTEARANELALLATKAQMDTFLGIASHELKSPLTHMQLSLEFTESRLRTVAERSAATVGDAGERTVALFQEHLTFTRQAVDQLIRLVDDLVDASRVQAGKLALRLEACDLGAIVQRAVDAQRQLAADRRIELQMPAAEGEAEGRIPVVADPGRIGQVVTNYLTNALKYSPPDRPVEVGVRIEHAREGEGQEVLVWVRDEGPGLPEDEREQVWERFHRAKGIEIQSGTGIGLGLGLYICRTIVEQHYGHVGVDSAPGAGSTFWFTVPLARVTVPELEAHNVQLPIGADAQGIPGDARDGQRRSGPRASAFL